MASTHEKFGPAVAVPRQSEIHCIQLPGLAMKSCGRGLHEIDAGRHRQRQEADQTHVVVEREPRHHHLALAEHRRLAAGVEVGGEHSVGDHDPLGLAGRAARVLQDDQPLRVGTGDLEPVARRDVGRPGEDRPHRLDRRVARRRRVERRQLLVDQHQLGVAVADAGPGRVDELLERAHPHRQGQHHRRNAGHPAAADDRHQLAAGRSQHGDVIAGEHAPRLQCGTHGAGVVVDLAPRHELRAIGRHRVTHEAHAGAGIGGALEPLDRRQCGGHGRDATAGRAGDQE